MTETPDMSNSPQAVLVVTPEQAQKAARASRLAAALRDNLRRRKAAHTAAKKPGN